MLPALTLTAVLTALPLPEPLPEAAFALADGRLSVRLTRGGAPLAGAGIRLLVGTQVMTTAETDADGRASLPRPSKPWCQIVCDVGAGPTAPIPLTFLSDDEVVPVSFPVRDGAADCCLIPARLRPAVAPPPPSLAWLYEPLIGMGAGSIAAGLLYAFIRRRSARPAGGRPKLTPDKRRKRR